MSSRFHERRAARRCAWPRWVLLGALGLGLPGCGKETPREAPPQNGKPAEPAPPPPAAPKAEQSASPLDKDSAAESAPAATPFAPPPATRAPARSSAKPDEKARRRAAPGKAATADGEADSADSALSEPRPTPRVLRQRLDDAVKLSTPDCSSARDRKQAICDLASQICQLVDRDPDVASVESYCDDAKQRCSEAERRTAQRCK